MHGGKMTQTNQLRDVIVNGLHSAAHEVSLMPKPGPTRVAQELLPPLLMRQGANPPFQRLKIAPVLPHPGMQREEREQEILMVEQSIGFCCYSLPDFRSEAQERL